MCHERLQKEYVQSHYSEDGKIKEGIKFLEIPYRKQNLSHSPEIKSNHKSLTIQKIQVGMIMKILAGKKDLRKKQIF